MIGTGAFWTTLAKEIRERRKHHVEELAKGNFASMPDAMKVVGGIKELDWVLGRAAAILGDNQHPISQPVDEDEF